MSKYSFEYVNKHEGPIEITFKVDNKLIKSTYGYNQTVVYPSDGYYFHFVHKHPLLLHPIIITEYSLDLEENIIVHVSDWHYKEETPET